jgi:hypothetical protein
MLVAERALETGQTLDIPKHREDYLHFTGSGLLVMGLVGYEIFARYPTSSATISPEQHDAIQRLGQDIDWRRSNPMWRRSIISPIKGTIQPHRTVLKIAVYDVLEPALSRCNPRKNPLPSAGCMITG